VRDRCNLTAVHRANPQAVVSRIRDDNMLAVDDHAAGLFETADHGLFFKFRARFHSEFPHVGAPVSLDRKVVSSYPILPHFQLILRVP
jgi:hypothetical protein